MPWIPIPAPPLTVGLLVSLEPLGTQAPSLYNGTYLTRLMGGSNKVILTKHIDLINIHYYKNSLIDKC